MRLLVLLLAVVACRSALAADGPWIAFYREGNQSVAFERSSLNSGTVNLLSVSPKKTAGTVVYAWQIVTQVHRFDCGQGTYRLLTKKHFDESGNMTSDETNVVTATNDAFKDRGRAVDTDALRKAQALVCSKSEPSPAKPFGSFKEAIGWMAN